MMEKDRRLDGHIACFTAYAIFGINIIVCKDLTGGTSDLTYCIVHSEVIGGRRIVLDSFSFRTT